MTPELTEIATALRAQPGVSVEVRGEGESAFLYVASIQRAAEVSRGERGWRVEYWGNADELPEDSPVAQEIVATPAEAAQRAGAWLSRAELGEGAE